MKEIWYLLFSRENPPVYLGRTKVRATALEHLDKNEKHYVLFATDNEYKVLIPLRVK
jgi:hypothetical protein